MKDEKENLIEMLKTQFPNNQDNLHEKLKRLFHEDDKMLLSARSNRYTPLIEDFKTLEVAASNPWARRSPEEIKEDIERSFESFRVEKPIEPTKILILGDSNMSRKEIVSKLIAEMNKNPLMDISFKEADSFLELKRDEMMVLKDPELHLKMIDTLAVDDLMVFKDRSVPEKFDTLLDGEFLKEEKPVKSKNFRDRPSIPQKKRRWKK